jgi:hypothetical protein
VTLSLSPITSKKVWAIRKKRRKKHAQKHGLDICKSKKKKEEREKDSPHPKYQKQRRESYKKEFIHKDHTLAYFN